MHRSNYRWTSRAATHCGYVRTTNEDAFLDAGERGLWVVADGMGGHQAGDVASRLVIDSLSSFEPGSAVSSNIDTLEDRLVEANRQCLAMSDSDTAQAGMGSTAVVLFAFADYCFTLWAGDSRIYHLRGNELRQLTEDHSLVQEMFSLGHLTVEEAEAHPSANVITRAVGVADQLYVDLDFIEVADGDRFLLCSDGLTRDLRDDELLELLRGGDPNEACERLVAEALSRGGGDNTTVIVTDAAAAS